MKNIEKAAKAILNEKGRVVLFGDADLDGVCSVIILKKTIESMGGSVSVYISDINRWGHGLTPDAVSFMQDESPALLVSLDCGIASFEGARAAKETGFRLIVVDHHEQLNGLPDAEVIVDPKQKGDGYHFKEMANAGVTFSLAQEMSDISFMRRELIELVALATVADMVPQKGENKEILDEGLPLLDNPRTPALKLLRRKIESDFVQKTVSLLNITENRGAINDAYLFLSAKTEKEAEKIVQSLFEKRNKRDEEIKKETEEIIDGVNHGDIIVFGGGSFPPDLAGAVASQVISRTKKPVFVFSKGESVSKGSARVPSGFSAVEAMEHCSDCLLSFGGHHPAAGFYLKNENIEKFKKCLTSYFYEKNNYIH